MHALLDRALSPLEGRPANENIPQYDSTIGKWKYIDGSSLGGGGGTSELISTTAITAVANIDITWDETVYSEIKLVIEDLVQATDATNLRARVGHTNGGTIITATQYHGINNADTSTWTDQGTLAYWTLSLGGSLGNAAGEYFQSTLYVKNFASANQGCTIQQDAIYHNSGGGDTVSRFFGHIASQAVAIDTISLYPASGNFTAGGTIYAYGVRNDGAAGGGAELSDLTDVNTSTPTNKNVLVADGVDWESRALNIDDISDVDTTTNVPVLGDTLVFDGTNWVTNLTQLIKEVDFVGTTTIYIGEAAPGTTTATAAWRVKRTVFTGDDSETLFADGDTNFDNTWTGRAGFSYS